MHLNGIIASQSVDQSSNSIRVIDHGDYQLEAFADERQAWKKSTRRKENAHIPRPLSR